MHFDYSAQFYQITFKFLIRVRNFNPIRNAFHKNVLSDWKQEWQFQFQGKRASYVQWVVLFIFVMVGRWAGPLFLPLFEGG